MRATVSIALTSLAAAALLATPSPATSDTRSCQSVAGWEKIARGHKQDKAAFRHEPKESCRKRQGTETLGECRQKRKLKLAERRCQTIELPQYCKKLVFECEKRCKFDNKGSLRPDCKKPLSTSKDQKSLKPADCERFGFANTCPPSGQSTEEPP